MLIGDSICEGYNSTVREALKDKYSVDVMASSRTIETITYKKQLEIFSNDFKYDLICFNNGLHGFHLPIDEYKAAYEEDLKLLGNTKMVLVLSTPLMKKENLNCYDEKTRLLLNAMRLSEVLQKNKDYRFVIYILS